MPHRTSALGRLPTISTSLTSSSLWRSSCPWAWLRSSVTHRLLRLMLFHTRPMPSRRSPQVRIGSPDPGCSTLMTSAPNSPSAVPTMGPAASVAASTTRTPSTGPALPAGSATAARRPSQPQVVAQRLPGVAVAEQAPALQLGDDQPHDVLVGPRAVRRGDHEPVARPAGEPGLHLVGDLRPGPDE